MHGGLVSAGVAGNATGVFAADLGLGLAEQALLRRLRWRLRARAVFEQQGSSDGSGGEYESSTGAPQPALPRTGTVRRAACKSV